MILVLRLRFGVFVLIGACLRGLVLLDNGRTAVLADEIGRAALHKSHLDGN